MKLKALFAGLALAVAAGNSVADNSFSTVGEIPVEAMSHGEMDQVEGKYYNIGLYGPLYYQPVIGSNPYERQFLIYAAANQYSASYAASAAYLNMIPGTLYGIPCIPGLTC